MMDYYLIFLGIMSILTYVIYKVDKVKAINNKYRIKESTLLLFSFIGGSIGALLAMYIIRHKNKKIKFIFFNWLFLLIHLIIGYYLLTIYN